MFVGCLLAKTPHTPTQLELGPGPASEAESAPRSLRDDMAAPAAPQPHLSARALAVASARRYYADPTSPLFGPYRYIPRPDSEQPVIVRQWDAERAAREAAADAAEEEEEKEAALAPAPPPPAPLPPPVSSSSSSSAPAAAPPSRKRRSARDDDEADEAPPPRLRKHGSKMEHVCDECGYATRRMGDLKKHIAAVHAGERPHVCDECGKAFGQKGGLARHYATMHAGVAYSLGVRSGGEAYSPRATLCGAQRALRQGSSNSSRA